MRAPPRRLEQGVRRLRDRPAPGEGEAVERAWRVVEAAYAERTAPAFRRRRGLRVVVAAVGAAAVALAAALTPAGAEVGDWIGERFASEREPAVPALAGLPAGGDVLTLTGDGAFVVHPDGALRRLGDFSDAGWSPHGLHVIGVDGRRLVAVTPTGTVKWTLPRPRAPHDPAWALGAGERVAYLEAGTLRVVIGDGTGDRLLRRRAAAVTPAWRPGTRYVLAYAGAGGLIETVHVDSGRRMWAIRAAERPVALAWSRDGSRLAALFERSLHVYDRAGRRLAVRELPGAGRAVALALHPSGRRAAVTVAGRAGARVLAIPLASERAARLLSGGPGRVEGAAWSPDGRRLVVAWREADQWLLLGPGRRVRAMSGVTAEFGNGAGFPRVAGWCCPAS
jgi:WD40-like Beta Propeller Repeat